MGPGATGTGTGTGFTRRQLGTAGLAGGALLALGSMGGPIAPALGVVPLTFVFPCDERRVSDDWAAHRARGSAGGTDYIAGYGSEVRAMANGVVNTADWTTSGSGGRYIRLDHGPMGQYKRVQTDYLHLSSLEVTEGQYVTTGQRIGLSGASGYGLDRYYGPHLHVSGWFDGVNLDIEPYVSAVSLTDATSLVYALYADILLRTPDAGGLSTWRDYLVKKGWPTLSVANAILYSDEYYLQRIDAAYKEILGRSADPVGRADWLKRMQSGSVSVDEIRMVFTRSLEYYQKAGGTDASYVRVLYNTMLGREPSQAETAKWVAEAQSKGGGYVVGSIWNSYESGTRRLNVVYNQFLKRDADPAGISSWVPLITTQGDQAARSTLVGSLEYLLQARKRYPQS